ncbi:uncharacterized protein [Spinacia oleracea]|uniref:Uncharacterized protein isoform X2 n=1 Tax=Spinacia oleracea TaxID=3562 RepID=A0ABM3QG83_SPIOL|nr:uncharacterized protein LOC130459189 isoform X2 [Spinacia oleracea]
MRKRERENPCLICARYRKFEEAEVYAFSNFLSGVQLLARMSKKILNMECIHISCLDIWIRHTQTCTSKETSQLNLDEVEKMVTLGVQPIRTNVGTTSCCERHAKPM